MIDNGPRMAGSRMALTNSSFSSSFSICSSTFEDPGYLHPNELIFNQCLSILFNHTGPLRGGILTIAYVTAFGEFVVPFFYVIIPWSKFIPYPVKFCL